MKAYKILLSMIALFVLLGSLWAVWPEDDIHIGGLTLRFESMKRSLAELQKEPEEEFDLDALLEQLEAEPVGFGDFDSTDFVDGFNPRLGRDTVVGRYSSYATSDPYRIFLPNDDYTYFDKLFRYMESAESRDTIVRVMHYGDSQIELDRISSVLRQRLQERFGGSGPGMVPAIQAVATSSVSQSYDGGWQRYTMYGDSTTVRARHNRYGVMAQFSKVSGSGLFTFRTSKNSAQPNVRRITRVSVLLGHNSDDFSVSLKCDTVAVKTQSIAHASDSVSLLTFKLPVPVQRGTLRFTGSAEVYAIMLDGGPGVAVDNDALRGCSGTIFSRIDKSTMAQSFALLNSKLIILQFGGNSMPVINNEKGISDYVKSISSQIRYFKQMNPDATLLFIGPSDMSKSVNGRLATWPLLENMNDSLRTHVLKDGVAYWDLFRTMGGNGSMIQWVKHNPPLAGPDYIHFTTKGAERVGDALARSMITYYDFFCIRKKIPEGFLNDSMSTSSIDKFMDSIFRKKDERDSVEAAASEPELSTIENSIVEQVTEGEM